MDQPHHARAFGGAHRNGRRCRRLRLECLESRCLLSTHDASDSLLPTHESGELDPFGDSPPRHDFLDVTDYRTGPSRDSPLEIAVNYLNSQANVTGLSADDLASLVVTDQYVSRHTGITHLYLRQVFDGKEIADAEVHANVARDGRLISLFSSFLPGLHGGLQQTEDDLNVTAPEAVEALASTLSWSWDHAVEVVGESYDSVRSTQLRAPGLSRADIRAGLQYVPTPQGIELAWRVEVQTRDGAHWYNASVSAVDGELLRLVDWVDHARYEVFALPLESPNDGDRSTVLDPHDPTASPFGWHDTDGVDGSERTDTRGNNVRAQEDANADDSGGSRPEGGAELAFDFDLDLGLPPSQYGSAAITNLFYWTNVLHDVYYQYGFDEAAGNFQQTNYSGQGAGNDPVVADAQDGILTDNAAMATPPDGRPPRMELHLWNRTSPHRDSDLDNGVIIHEYGHGVSERLTGGPSYVDALRHTQSRAMGEGWSDWWALMLTQNADDEKWDAYPIATYLLGESGDDAGIRRYPYSVDREVDPLTLDDFNRNHDAHDAGEIWASALWDLNWRLIDKYGFDPDLYHGAGGNNVALQLVMDAMKLQPANPSFLDGRDAILSADLVLTGGANHDAIWSAFARRGLGFGAEDGGSANSKRVVESFDLPPGRPVDPIEDRPPEDIAVETIPSAPRLDLNGRDQDGVSFSAEFVEESGPVSIVDTSPLGPLTIEEAKDGTVVSATVRIVNPWDGDAERLDVNTLGTPIVKRYQGNTLTLTGTATAAAYEAILQSLTYENTSSQPSAADRVIQVLLQDGKAFSAPAEITVTVRYLDSGPVRVEADVFRVVRNETLVVTSTSLPVVENAVGVGLAANDVTDPRDVGDPARLVPVEAPHDRETSAATGTLRLDAAGTFTFTPDRDYTGTVEFTYSVDDGFHVYGPATVTVEVVGFVPRAGDANQDRQFNQADIVLVLQSAKYLTGRRARWAEGDWNQDGVFDPLDIVAALQNGEYLPGPSSTWPLAR